MKQTTVEEVSAGGVVYRVVREITNLKFSNSQIRYEFLIGKHSGYHKWVLPKGLVERGESQMEAAVREVAEEVGVQARIVDLPAQAGMAPLKTIEYYYYADLAASTGTDATGGQSERRVRAYQEDPTFAAGTGGVKTRIHKRVIFYLMECEQDLGQAGWEMEERKWVGYEEGKELLAFETEREVFAEAGRVLGCL
jgi:8-oxo-dGTP pyrophosphatase MutT (NUDIX family)